MLEQGPEGNAIYYEGLSGFFPYSLSEIFPGSQAETHGINLFAELQQAVMQPVFNKWLAIGKALRLGYLVLVMGENKVLPTAMDIKGITQVFQRHGTALNMPARSALPPGRFP